MKYAAIFMFTVGTSALVLPHVSTAGGWGEPVLTPADIRPEPRPVGCVIYSAPPRECDKRYGGKTWELARLYLLDEVPQNAETWLIAQSVKWIKRNHPEVCNLVSYADPSAGHSGTIYRAANWREDGRTDDERKTPRCDYYDARTGKKYGRRGNMPADAVVERRPRVSKYRFALAIRRPNAM